MIVYLFIDLIAEIVVRCFFSMIHFILMALMESHFDFFQFRWLTVLAINQLLILYSIELNPFHSILVVGVVIYPIMSILQLKDLKKVDPFRTLIRVKGEYEEEEMLPRGGMTTISGKWETRQMAKEIGVDTIVSVGVMMYLMWLKEYVTPDFFHFVMCLGEDAAHSIWIIFLWLTFKCYFSKPISH
jgi:hypothetical protein